MEVETRYINVNKKTRYVTYGRLHEGTKYFWFALHGSKMRCEQVLYKFQEFDPDTHFVVAPEALNKFYLKGFGGDVVASWMTSRDRLNEIEDFSNYLSDLYHQFIPQLNTSCKKIVLGFSQGGTTLYRWLHANEITVDVLIAYSCWIPEDIDLTLSKTDLSSIKQYYTYGIEDQFLTKDRIEMMNQVISKNQLDIEWLPYKGEHKIDKEQLNYMVSKI